MVTADRIRNEPQLRFGEVRVEDAHLERLLAERDEAKRLYEDAKGYLDDYLDQKAFIEGEFRIGPHRLKVKHKTTVSITKPTK